MLRYVCFSSILSGEWAAAFIECESDECAHQKKKTINSLNEYTQQSRRRQWLMEKCNMYSTWMTIFFTNGTHQIEWWCKN